MNEFYEMFTSLGGTVLGKGKQRKLALAVKHVTVVVGDRAWTEDDTQQAMLIVLLEGRGKILNGSLIAETLRNTPMRYDSEQGKFVRSICAGMTLYNTESPLEGKSESEGNKDRIELLDSIESELGASAAELSGHLIDGIPLGEAIRKMGRSSGAYADYEDRKWWNTIKYNLIPLLEGIQDES